MPSGDNAGYFQKLHALWDGGYRVNALKGGAPGPMTELFDIGCSDSPDMERVASAISEIIGKYLPEHSDLTTDPVAWTSESSQIACDWAFSTPRENSVSPGYVACLHDTCCARPAQAGAK